MRIIKTPPTTTTINSQQTQAGLEKVIHVDTARSDWKKLKDLRLASSNQSARLPGVRGPAQDAEKNFKTGEAQTVEVQDKETIYFQYENELFQHFKTADKDIIFCASQDGWLDLSVQGGLLDSIKTRDFDIYAETVKLPEQLDCQNLVLVCRELKRANEHAGVAIVAKADGAAATAADGTPADPNGKPGKAGGNVSIQVLDSDNCLSWLSITSSGEGGGAGYNNPAANGVGGSGGKGGDGGNITLSVPSRYPQIAEKLAFTLEADAYDKYQAANALLQAIKSGKLTFVTAEDIENLEQSIDAFLGAGFDGDAEKPLISALQIIGLKLLTQDSQSLEIYRTQATDSRGGSYGVYGSGEKPGKNGQAGRAGDKTIVRASPISGEQSKLENLQSIYHIEMLLQKALVSYLMASDAVTQNGVNGQSEADTKSTAQITDTFKSILNRCDIALASKEIENQSVKQSFEKVRASVQTLLQNIQLGRDYFQNDARTVPDGSWNLYKDLLLGDGNIKGYAALFNETEQTYQSYFDAVEQGKIDASALQSALDTSNGIISSLESDLKRTEEDLTSLYSRIYFPSQALNHQKQVLIKDLIDFEQKIKHHFSIDVAGLLSALSTCALCPESEFQWIVQGATALNGSVDWADSIKTASGLEIHKNVLLRHVSTLEQDLSALTETYTQLEGSGIIRESDPDGVKLVALENKLESMLDDLYAACPQIAERTKKDLATYVSAVSARNETIISYNAKLNEYYQKQLKVADLKAKANSVSAQVGDVYDPNMADNTAFMSTVYQNARQEVMNLMYKLDRSYQYWALDGQSLLSNLGASAPAKIDASLLLQLQMDILRMHESAIEQYGQNAQTFSEDNPVVVEYRLSDSDKALLPEAGIMKTLFVATKASTSRHTDKNYNAFAGKSNVRLSNVRAFLTNAKTKDGHFHLQIQHSGRDTICSPTGKTHTFEHGGKLVGFEYDVVGDEIKVTSPGGNLFESDRPSERDEYARPGPFTFWTIKAPKALNDELDLSQCDTLRIEFAGSYNELAY